MSIVDVSIYVGLYVVFPIVLVIAVVDITRAYWRKPSVERVANEHPAPWDLVIADMNARHEIGLVWYGSKLQAHNGRDMLRDAYDEALDLCVHLRGAMYERDGH